MKLLVSSQIKAWDKYTIENEPIISIDLMERASLSFIKWFVSQPDHQARKIIIICGNGNNGGDGLAIARLLRDRFFEVEVYVLRFLSQDSIDFDINLGRLLNYGDVKVYFIHDDIFQWSYDKIIVDALLGTGTNKPVTGILQKVIRYINETPFNKVISVDMPSGLPSEGIAFGDAVESDVVFTFQLPKLSFFLKENAIFCEDWKVGNIGLDVSYSEQIFSEIYLVDKNLITGIYQKRSTFGHKGDYGHALIIAGSNDMLGAAVLAVKACLKSGTGLVTAMIPIDGKEIIHMSVPEAIVKSSGQLFFDIVDFVPDLKYTIGVGPGLGRQNQTVIALKHLIKNCTKPLVLDADALNIIADEKELLEQLPPGSVITPHPKEFERLFGKTSDSEAMYDLQKEKSVLYKLNIVLKGAYTHTTTPEGKTYINTTGNSGMATGGTGDVLTGIITGLMAQKYMPEQAAILGVYLHGLAGDMALKKESVESLSASDIILNMGAAFRHVLRD